MIYNDYDIIYYFEYYLLFVLIKCYGNFYNFLLFIFIKNVKNWEYLYVIGYL